MNTLKTHNDFFFRMYLIRFMFFFTMVLLAYSVFKNFQYVLKFLFDFRNFRGHLGGFGPFLLALCVLLFSL